MLEGLCDFCMFEWELFFATVFEFLRLEKGGINNAKMTLFTFILGRIKSVKFAIKGMFLLLKTEHAIITQFSIGVLLIIAGFYFDISRIDWIIQLAVIGFVLALEGVNTAIEKVCDFVHINFDKRIGFIKDVSAGAVSFAVFFSFLILVLMYYPYLFEKGA